MSKFQTILVLIVLFVLFAPGLAIAQQAPTPTAEVITLTPDPEAPSVETPVELPAPVVNTETILVVTLAIVSVLLMVFAGAFVVFARQLLNAAPPWVADLIRDTARRGLSELDRIVGETPGTLDDEMARFIRTEIEKALIDAFERPTADVQAALDDASRKTSG